METSHKTGRKYLVLVAIIYLVSLAFPVLGADFRGFHAFVWGLIYCWLVPLAGLSWFANVALWFGIYYLNLERWCEAKRCGIVAIGMGLTVLPLWAYQERIGIGYYVWLLSMAALTWGAVQGERAERRERVERKRLVRQRRLSNGTLGLPVFHDPLEILKRGRINNTSVEPL